MLPGFNPAWRGPRGPWSWWGRLRLLSKSSMAVGAGISSCVPHPRGPWARFFEHSEMDSRPRGGTSEWSSIGILPRFSERREPAATHPCGVSDPRKAVSSGIRHPTICLPPYLVPSGGSGCQISCPTEKLAGASRSPRRIAPGPSREYFPHEVSRARDLFPGPRERALGMAFWC